MTPRVLLLLLSVVAWVAPLPEPFNQCHADPFGGSQMAVCDVTTGESRNDFFSDQQCSQLDTKDPYRVSTAGCLPCGSNLSCGYTVACTEDEPSSIDPTATYNVIGMQYTDAECTDPTGVEEVFNVEDFSGCKQATGGSSHFQYSCAEGDILLLQLFTADDSTCTGEVMMEAYSDVDAFRSSVDASGSGCMTENIGGFYYGYHKCTTSAATVTIGRGDATTPSPAAPTPGSPEAPTPAATTPSPSTPINIVSIPPITSSDGSPGTPNTLAPEIITSSSPTRSPPLTTTQAPVASSRDGIAGTSSPSTNTSPTPSPGFGDAGSTGTLAPSPPGGGGSSAEGTVEPSSASSSSSSSSSSSGDRGDLASSSSNISATPSPSTSNAPGGETAETPATETSGSETVYQYSGNVMSVTLVITTGLALLLV